MKSSSRIYSLLVSIAFVATPMFASATTYYVATTGSDSNPGTIGSPFASLQAGANAAVAGDTVLVEDGTYGAPASCGSQSGDPAVYIHDHSGTSGSPITIKAQNKWGAILDGQASCDMYFYFGTNTAWWVIQDFDIKNAYKTGIASQEAGTGVNFVVTGNIIHNIGNHPDATTIGTAGIYTEASAIMTISNNIFHDIGRTDDTGSPSPNAYDHGIYTHGTMTIINNLFYRSLYGWGIQTALGFSGLIANNTFVGPNMYPHATKNGQIVLWDVANGAVTIRNNIFYQPNGSAIVTVSYVPTGCNIDHNITTTSSIYDNGASCTLSANTLSTDPLLVDSTLTAPDGHLQSTSPAKDTGTTVAQVTDDYDGVTRPQGSVYDMGAYEYDQTAPSASVTAPSNGGTVSGSAVTVSANASDNVAVAGVKFYINGVLQGSEDTTAPYAITWNTTATSTGSKTIIAVARDTSNNYATSSSISVTVTTTGSSNPITWLLGYLRLRGHIRLR